MSAAESIIRIENVTKTFGSFTAIKDVSLDVSKGSFTTLLGPSGCGKTTLMRLIAGFHEPDGGTIVIEGKKVNGIPAYKRNTPLVFQEYALFPHMTVYENISYGLKLKKLSRKEMKDKVDVMLDMFGLQGMENRFPKQLSGGQQQRVAFARALITGQNILLMDEPLSNLDAKMRVEVRSELRELQQRTGITAIFVTHDQDEALSLSDRIAVFDKGHICQVGTPWEVYFKPQTAFVADFVGVANFIKGQVVGIENQDIIVRSTDGPIRVNKGDYNVDMGQEVTLVIRPECISIIENTNTDARSENVFIGTIVQSSFLGRMIRYWVQAGSLKWIVDDTSPSVRGTLQGTIKIALDKNKIHILPKES
ncbi:spermidine/putrescine transport system ATP-binding protein [Paenibacillus sp. 1_12]|uniref:ABC transporter ATP-binding protein n=1 Tax=Paenibacillus sp. 1_12 TaxID=1566278 RepID=UPI0008E191EA|nr:ABC transporter ATP-binding protein [Paenibacillus sp. 1_12]SFL23547.1 spermidine/putrescine transport system ATP-binding protein [Paenibacillus sp. 1_12]